MSENWQWDVLDQHRRLCPDQIGTTPVLVTGELLAMRLRLIEEEYTELRDALESGDLPGAADGMGDLLVVVLGTAVAMGVDMNAIMQEIHRANIAKTPRREGTFEKWGKPPGWKPPDIAAVLVRQPPLAHIYPRRGEP